MRKMLTVMRLSFGLRIVFVLLLGSEPVLAQRFSIGVKGGVPLSDPIQFGNTVLIQTYSSKPNRYTIGPTIEVSGLPFGLGIEVDALYKHVHYNYASHTGSYIPIFRPTGGSGMNEQFSDFAYAFDRWEFPILGKYRLTRIAVSKTPYALGGFNINRLSRATLVGVGGFRSWGTGEPVPPFTISTVGPGPLPPGFFARGVPPELHSRSAKGVVLGAGIDWRIPLVHVSPELRYTRWTKRNFALYDNGSCPKDLRSSTLFCSNLNQLELLLGITF
jgi:hypothetical protein